MLNQLAVDDPRRKSIEREVARVLAENMRELGVGGAFG